MFGQSLFELANFVAAAWVFGQLIGPQPFSWMLMSAGVIAWGTFVTIGLWLVGEG